jgi:hypothetical protein
LAFLTAPWAFLIGSRPCPASSSETYRFARSEPVGDGPKAVPTGWTALMGLIESLLHRHGRLCVHSRPDRRLDFGPELPRSEHVPFLPFLPAPTVSSAEARSEDRTLDSSRVCCTPQPVLEFATFPTSRPLGRSRPEGRGEVFPSGEDPSKLSPLRQPSSASPLPPSSRRGSAFTARAFPLAVLASHRRRVATTAGTRFDLRAFVRRRVRCTREVLPPRGARCSHGLWIEHVPCLPRQSPARRGRAPFRRAVSWTAAGVPRPRAGRRQRFSAVSGSEGADACIRPEGRRAPVQLLAARRLLRFWSARRLRAPCGGERRDRSKAPARPSNESEESRHPPHRVPKEHVLQAPMGTDEKPEGSRRIAAARPKRIPTAGPFHPKVLGLRPPRHAPKSASRPGAPPGEQARGQAPVVRASASGRGHPKAPRPGARDSTPTSRTQPPPKRRLLHRNGAWVVDAPPVRGAPKGIASNPLAFPPEGDRGQAKPHPKMRPRGSGASPASWRVPASGQTDIVSIQERSGFGPRTRTSRRPGGRRADARASGARRIRAAHPCFRVALRRGPPKWTAPNRAEARFGRSCFEQGLPRPQPPKRPGP